MDKNYDKSTSNTAIKNQKQEQKPHEFGTPRLKVPEDVVLIDEKEASRIEEMLKQFGKSLESVRDKNGWTNKQMLARLNYEYFPNVETLSRFIAHTNKRIPSLAKYLDALRAFGPDMELTANKSRDIKDLTNAELIRELERISIELSSRTRQG